MSLLKYRFFFAPCYHSELAQRIVDWVNAVRRDEQMDGMHMSTEFFEMALRVPAKDRARLSAQL